MPWSGTILPSSEPSVDRQVGHTRDIPKPLDGAVDGLTLFNRALTAEEIRQRYLSHVSTVPLVNAGPGRNGTGRRNIRPNRFIRRPRPESLVGHGGLWRRHRIAAAAAERRQEPCPFPHICR